MQIKSSLKQISCIYDFAVNGGAIGNIPLGIYLPARALITRCDVITLIPFTSAGAAQMGLGFLVGGNIVLDPIIGDMNTVYNNLSPFEAIAFNSFINTTIPYANENLVILATATQFKMQITLFALTAGKAEFHLQYIERN